MSERADEPPRAEESRPRRGGCMLLLAVAALWWFLLHDFVSAPFAILLSVVGAALAYAGLYLSLAGARYVFESVWYAGAWLLGLLMLAGAAASLAPAAPGVLLMTTPSGWRLLASRATHLEAAIEAGDVELATKIARRGLGDPAARDGFGTPILHLAKDDPEMLESLLEAGLDPDAHDAEGRTLLRKTTDTEVRRLLLGAGATPMDGPGSARPRSGRNDWLVASADSGEARIPSGVSLEPDPLHPGEVGTVRIVVDNASSQDRLLDVRAALDNGVFFVDASHGGSVADVGIPAATATVRWPLLTLPAGARGELEMRVLARADEVVPGLLAGGLSVDVRIVDQPQRSEEVLGLYQERAGGPGRAPITSAAGLFPVVPPLVLALVLWLVWRRARASYSRDPQFRFGRVVAAGAAVACAAAAAGLMWSMIEPYVRFDEAACRVLDRRVFAMEVRRAPGDRSVNRPPVMQLHPAAAVEIDTGDEVRIAAGMSTGGVSRSVQELRMLPIGLETKCWMDPRNPGRFTLVRGLPLAGGVGLAMLLALTVVLGLIATRLGRSLERTRE